MNYFISNAPAKKIIKGMLLCTVFALSINELAMAEDEGVEPPDMPQHQIDAPAPMPPSHR